MYDLRPVEKFSSVLLLPTLFGLPLGMGAIFTIAGLAMGADLWIPALTGVCTLIGTPLFAWPLLALFRWSRTGRAREFLDDLADELRDGDVSCATWLWSMISPRLEGEVDGYRYRLTLRRSGGVLTPSRVGGMFLIWGWMYEVRLEAKIGSRVGFLPARSGTVGASLFGLSGAVELDHLTAYAGSTDRGRAIVQRPDVQAAALRALDFGRVAPLLRVGPDAIDASGQLRGDVRPIDVAKFLRALAALAKAASAP